MSTTKVLHVIARMNIGGTARYVGDLVEHLPENLLATGDVQGAEIEDPSIAKLPIIRIPYLGRKISPVNDFRAWLELRTIVKEFKPQLIHTHTFKAGLIGRLVSGSHQRVHTFHGHLFDDQSFSPLEKKVITYVEKYLAKRTDLLISVGERVGVELRAAGIGGNQKWTSVAPGVKPLTQINKTEARRQLGLNEEDLIIGWMARMAEVKNPFLLLEVARKMPEVNFIMAGGGQLLAEIEKQAPTNVDVIGWTDASHFWAAVDCAVSTSDNEGIPIALIEAQLAGVPVVATDAGSTREVISDGYTGFVTGKNSDDLVQALYKIILDSKLRSTFSTNAMTFASRNFQPEKMLESHAKIYSELIGE